MSCLRERDGPVVECLTRDRGAAGLSLSSVTTFSGLYGMVNDFTIMLI